MFVVRAFAVGEVLTFIDELWVETPDENLVNFVNKHHFAGNMLEIWPEKCLKFGRKKRARILIKNK